MTEPYLAWLAFIWSALFHSGGDGTLWVRDSETEKETITLKGQLEVLHRVSFSPDGKRIVSGSGDKTYYKTSARYLSSRRFTAAHTWLKVWDAQTGQETLTLKGHLGPVISVSFSPDGKRIGSCGSGEIGEPGEIKVWDISALDTSK